MSKLKLAIVIIGVAVLASAGTASADYIVHTLSWTKNIYVVSDPEPVNCGGIACQPNTVSTFDNAGNRCYMVKASSNDQPANISCVRMK